MVKSRFYSGRAGVAALITIFASVGVAQNTPRPLITSSIDEETRVTLAGNTRSEANAVNDRGRMDDSIALDHMFLLLQRSPEREQALVTMIDQLHDRNRPIFITG